MKSIWGWAVTALALSVGSAQAAPRGQTTAANGLTFGVGIGGGYGDVEYERAGVTQSESGMLTVVSLRLNAFIGPIALGGRYMQDTNQREAPRERAALVGLHIPRSPISLLIGRGDIDNADDDAPDDIRVTSWELLIAPHAKPVNFIIHGANGDASYTAFSVAVVFGDW